MIMLPCMHPTPPPPPPPPTFPLLPLISASIKRLISSHLLLWWAFFYLLSPDDQQAVLFSWLSPQRLWRSTDRKPALYLPPVLSFPLPTHLPPRHSASQRPGVRAHYLSPIKTMALSQTLVKCFLSYRLVTFLPSVQYIAADQRVLQRFDLVANAMQSKNFVRQPFLQ